MLLIKYVRNEDCKKCLHLVTSSVVKTHKIEGKIN